MKSVKILFLSVISIFIFSNLQAQKTPNLNKQIFKYVKSVMNEKVDRGECWDLANQALILVNADWDKRYVYGNKINPNTDQVFPGDLIQFKNIKIRFKKGNTTYTELMPHHTAIVYKVLDKGVYEIAHQNTDFSGRKVGISELNLNYIIEGEIYFYRPTLKLSNE